MAQARLPLPASVRQWTPTHVAAWVHSLPPPLFRFDKLFEYTTGEALLTLSDADLAGLGIANLGARRSLLAAIGKLDAGAPSATRTAPAEPSGPVPPPLPPGYLYHAFISYRRGSSSLPALIESELKARGLRVCVPINDPQSTASIEDSLAALQGNLAALRASCCDVFVLAPGTLDWCGNDPEDWVRLEIAEACHLGKAIIPVVADPNGFPSTEGLPADMAAFPRHRAYEPPAEEQPADAAARPKEPPPPLVDFGGKDMLLVRPGDSITDAVKRASPGQTILLAAGRYTEQVTLEKKEVHILGPRKAVLEWDKGETLVCRGPAAPSVRGITIRNTKPGHAVCIAGGSRASIEGCDVSSAGWQGVAAFGERTAPTLGANAVHGCGYDGVYFYHSAKGSIEENDIFGNRGAGVEIASGADPVVRGNKIHDQEGGIWVCCGGKGVLAGNTIERIDRRAIIVELSCSGCRVQGNAIG